MIQTIHTKKCGCCKNPFQTIHSETTLCGACVARPIKAPLLAGTIADTPAQLLKEDIIREEDTYLSEARREWVSVRQDMVGIAVKYYPLLRFRRGSDVDTAFQAAITRLGQGGAFKSQLRGYFDAGRDCERKNLARTATGAGTVADMPAEQTTSYQNKLHKIITEIGVVKTIELLGAACGEISGRLRAWHDEDGAKKFDANAASLKSVLEVIYE